MRLNAVDGSSTTTGADARLTELLAATRHLLNSLDEAGRTQLPEGLVEPYIDEPIYAVTVRHLGPWRVSLASMAFNIRVLLTAESQYPRTWTSGFCYDPGPAPILAALSWNPLADVRPTGWKKIAAEDATTYLRENAAWGGRG